MTIILAQKDNLSFCHLGSLSLDKRSKPNFPFGYHINSPNLCLLTFFNIYIQGCLVPVLCLFINRWWRQNVVKAKEGKTSPGRVLMFRHLGLDFTPFLVVNWNNPAYKFSKPLAMWRNTLNKFPVMCLYSNINWHSIIDRRLLYSLTRHIYIVRKEYLKSFFVRVKALVWMKC